MRALWLIAFNFLREQRWPVFVLLLWVLLLAFLGLFTDVRRNREDLLFIFKQVAFYVLLFSIFFGGSALYSERKSRRILAVLSKAVGRSLYLAGLVCGVMMASAIYCFSLGLTGSWTLGQAGFPVWQIWAYMISLLIGCTLAGTVALMFSTFLNPFFAAGATASVLAFPVLASHVFSASWRYVVPVYPIAAELMQSSFQSPGHIPWRAIGLAVVEILLFFALAVWTFSRVDVVVAVD